MNYQELINSIKNKEITLSFSSLKQFAKSPEHFIRYKLEKKEPTPAMIFGSLVDCFVFDQQDKFNEMFYIGKVVPTSENQISFCSYLIDIGKLNGEITDADIESSFVNSYKKGDPQTLYISLKPYIDARIANKNVVTQADVDHAIRMKEKLYENKAGGRLMNLITDVQKKVEWEFNDWKFVGYIDGLGESLLMDLKTTDADPDKISRFVKQNKTYVQLAMYNFPLAKEGIKIEDFKVLALDAGLNISVNIIDKDYIRYGAHEYKLWMQEFNKCVLMNRFQYNYDFHGKYKGEYLIQKPTWADTLMPVWDDENRIDI